jgi:hypothetical protein
MLKGEYEIAHRFCFVFYVLSNSMNSPFQMKWRDPTIQVLMLKGEYEIAQCFCFVFMFLFLYVDREVDREDNT